MRIVIPFFDGNKAIAVKLCRWIGHLDGTVDARCILMYHSQCDPADVVSAASGVFAEVELHRYDVMGPLQWPFGKNSAWQSAARIMAMGKDPWLWLEPDAIPLVKGWFPQTGKLYTDGKRPYAGFILPGLQQLEGVAVYPADVAHQNIEAMLCRAAPFDQVAGKTWALNATPLNGLFVYQHDVDGQPVTFKDEAAVEQFIPKGAILFHRCKDGSLIDVLSRGIFHRMAAAVAQMLKVAPEPPPPCPDTVDTCIVLLGRYGDIVNILPVVADMKPKVALMVAKQFADLLDGVTYCQKEVFDGGFTDITQAVAIAKGKYKRVVVAQVSAMSYGTSTKCDAFNVESWRQVGYMSKWGALPLKFDNRDLDRERKLVKKHLKSGKKRILVATGGFSSPYPHAERLLKAIQERFDQSHHVILLNDIKAERIYDLLGLFDAADVLVSTDTAVLHLAAASDIPVVALISDQPTLWHGSRPPKNTVAAFRYWESSERMDVIMDAIGRAAPRTRFYHVWSHYYVKDPETTRRYEMARQTWRQFEESGCWVEVATEDSVLPRLFKDSGHGRQLVFIKDLMEHGCRQARDRDVIVLTNADICISSSAVSRLQERMENLDVCYAFRRDFARIDKPLKDSEIRGGALYSGTDLFAFRVSWWLKNRDSVPDMLIGAEYWDWVMRMVIDQAEPDKSVSFIDLIYHERHPTYWENPDNRGTCASQLHNRQLVIDFRQRYGIHDDGLTSRELRIVNV